MSKPDDIPQDIWQSACVEFDKLYDADPQIEGGSENGIVEAIARAVLAERERLTAPEFLARQIEAVGMVGKEAVSEAVEAERRRLLAVIEEVRVSPQWSGKEADWICGAIVDWSNETPPHTNPDRGTP